MDVCGCALYVDLGEEGMFAGVGGDAALTNVPLHRMLRSEWTFGGAIYVKTYGKPSVQNNTLTELRM